MPDLAGDSDCDITRQSCDVLGEKSLAYAVQGPPGLACAGGLDTAPTSLFLFHVVLDSAFGFLY